MKTIPNDQTFVHERKHEYKAFGKMVLSRKETSKLSSTANPQLETLFGVQLIWYRVKN